MTLPALSISLTEAESHWSEVVQQFTAMVAHLQQAETLHQSQTDIENYLTREGRELQRRLLQAHLDERAPGTVAEPVRAADHTVRPLRATQTRQLESPFGRVSLSRAGYGATGTPSLHPLDAQLNLPPELYSHNVRRQVAETAAAQSFDEVVAQVATHSGAHVPKRQAEALTVRAAQDFDAFYAQRTPTTSAEAAATSDILVITTDGKGVPMRREDLQPATQKAADAAQPRLQKRRSRGEKAQRKRMSTVAAVYTMAPHVRTPEQIVQQLQPVHAVVTPPRPEHKRVWASLRQPPEDVLAEAFTEAARRDPDKTKTRVALVDGGPQQLRLLQAAAVKHQVTLIIILDLIHVLEYLWKAAWALHAEGDPQAEAWVSARLLAILRGRSASVAAGLRRLATRRQLNFKERAPLDKCADYLSKYREYLRYDEYLAAGYPIATGVIEGACRYVVKDRMERTGARWRLDGAEAVLRLRSLHASGDKEAYWAFHLQQEYQRHHVTQYADGQVPVANPQLKKTDQPPRLRLVK
jgi:hypothetical protein